MIRREKGRFSIAGRSALGLVVPMMLTLLLMLSCASSGMGEAAAGTENGGDASGSSPVPEADLVIQGGPIYTAARDDPRAEAVAVRGDRIAAVGPESEIRRWIGNDTQVLNLGGRTMTPGFIESHGHLLALGRKALSLDVSGAETYGRLVELVARAVRRSEPGAWIVGGGWHQSKWSTPPEPEVRGFPTHAALSRVSPENPVLLFHASGHAALANRRAMAVGGITEETVFEAGGEVLKDADGEPTGVLIEAAQSLVARHMPPPGPEQAARALEAAVERSLERGITTFHEAASGRRELRLYTEALQQGRLDLRLYVMITPDREDPSFLAEQLERGPRIGLGGGFLTVRTVKLFADGALGSRGAWLLEPYADDPAASGHALLPMEEVRAISERALSLGFQVATHAIGDRAVREVLDTYERTFRGNPPAARDHRFRIEHAQHIDPRDLPRFSELGVIAAMQGIHMASDILWAVDRLGRERIAEGAYMWRDMLAAGTVVTNGSDAPVETVDPVPGFYASVTRRTLDGTRLDWSHPEQRMTRDQALHSYTIAGAFAAFEEAEKGSIEVGKLADFTVFSQDIMTVPEARLLDTTVYYTIVGGEIVYARSLP